MKPAAPAARTLPIADFPQQSDWSTWLEEHHQTSPGVWLRLSKKGAKVGSVSYEQAVETALCFGWIDGQKDRFDDQAWLQKFTPRGPRSGWSKINRDKVAKLLESGSMRPAGLAAVEQARKNGQWEGAYDSPSKATVPPDFQAELDKSKSAKAFFATLNGTNRYAVLYRIQTAKKPETRARKIGEIIEMLKRKETIHPQG